MIVKVVKAFSLCLFMGLFVVGCMGKPLQMPAAPPPSPEPEVVISTPACPETKGVVEQMTLTGTTRGYDYDYAIYLPPCYALETAHDYPVLYLIPGRGGGPNDWFNAGVAQLADEMIVGGEIPAFIIVATDDTDADPMAQTIKNDLIPAVTGAYRILPDRQFQAVAGGSLGGIATYRLVFQHPEQFSQAGLFGSGVIHGEEAQVQAWLAAMTPQNRPHVFLNTGEQDPLMLAQAEVMLDLLNDAGLETTTVFSPGAHTYGYWVENMPAYFKELARAWTVDE